MGGCYCNGCAGDINRVGSIASGTAFYDNASADDQWLGLGSSAGRIEFDDQTTDEINILNANLGVGTNAPSYLLTVEGQLAFLETGTSPTYYTIFQGGDQSANLTYTWPTAMPGANNYVLTSQTDGSLAWQSVSGVGSLTGGGASGEVAYWTGTSSLGGENQLGASRGGTGVDGSSAANGQLLIGNGTGYTLATLTDSTGITITEGAGSISIASTLGTDIDLTSEVTGTLPVGPVEPACNLRRNKHSIVHNGS